MLFEDSAIVGTSDPISPSSMIDPQDPVPAVEPSVQFSQTGFVVVGAESTSNGQMMLVYDAQGKALGAAFDDGDGNWDNEWDALTSGLQCTIAGGATVLSEGTLAAFTGAAAVVTCADFLYNLGSLYDEYQGTTYAYNQSVTVFLNPENHNGWDGQYNYTYQDGSSWTILYDTQTQSFGEWVWNPAGKEG